MCEIVFCTVDDSTKANRIVDRLKTSGFSATDVSVLLPGAVFQNAFNVESFGNSTVTNVSADNTQKRSIAFTGVGAGIDWLTGIGVLAVPGIGSVVAAGPVMQILSGKSLDESSGDLTHALMGMGVPEYYASDFDKKTKSGQIFMAVHAQNDIEVNVIVKTFEAVGACNVATIVE